MLKEGSTVAIVDGGDAIIRFSVRYRRKGTKNHQRLRASWLDFSRRLGMSRVVMTMVSTARLREAPDGGDGNRPGG
jgi:hypothetical protein